MAIAEQVRKEAPLERLPPILVGDFNARPESSEIRFLKGLQSLQGKSYLTADATSHDRRRALPFDAHPDPFAAATHEYPRRLDTSSSRTDRAVRGKPCSQGGPHRVGQRRAASAHWAYTRDEHRRCAGDAHGMGRGEREPLPGLDCRTWQRRRARRGNGRREQARSGEGPSPRHQRGRRTGRHAERLAGVRAAWTVATTRGAHRRPPWCAGARLAPGRRRGPRQAESRKPGGSVRTAALAMVFSPRRAARCSRARPSSRPQRTTPASAWP